VGENARTGVRGHRDVALAYIVSMCLERSCRGDGDARRNPATSPVVTLARLAAVVSGQAVGPRAASATYETVALLDELRGTQHLNATFTVFLATRWQRLTTDGDTYYESARPGRDCSSHFDTSRRVKTDDEQGCGPGGRGFESRPPPLCP
jgi:hypothetical protein